MTRVNSLPQNIAVPIPRSVRGKATIDPEHAGKSSVLSQPPAGIQDRVKNRQTHRITPVAKVFIIQCINSGFNNQQINKLLRKKQFVVDGEPDLSHDTLAKLRGLDECLLDIALMTKEARQVGHNHVSKLILVWAELSDEASSRLLGKDNFGAAAEKWTVRECCKRIAAQKG